MPKCWRRERSAPCHCLTVFWSVSLCVLTCVCECVDRKQVPSVYHSSIYSENKSQIWEESFYHLRGGQREREREGGEKKGHRKMKRWKLVGKESISDQAREVEVRIKSRVRRFSLVSATGELNLLCLSWESIVDRCVITWLTGRTLM